MRTLLLVAVVLAAAGGLTWYLLGPSTGEGPVDPYADGAGLEEEGAGPSLTAAGQQRRPGSAETRGAGWIQGTVRRAGEPLAATVELRHLESIDPRNPFGDGAQIQMIARMLDSGVSTKDVLMKTSARDDGTFRFKNLAPGRYEVRATTDGGAMGFAGAALPAEGAHVEASIEIPVGDETLQGRVVYADGRPYQGIVITSSGEGFAAIMGGGGDIRPGHTDADGRFTFGGLAPGKISVSAILPGRMRVMGAPVQLPHAGEYLLTIDGGGIDLKGKVLRASDETPVAGATVFGGGGDPSTRFSIHSTTTAADGTFAISVPAGRGGGLLVQADGYAPANVNMRDGNTENITVTLLALGSVSGRVTVRENGSPAAGVSVFAQGASDRGGMPTASSTVTDADGRYALANVAPGAANIYALGAGWVSEGYSGGLGSENSPFVAAVEPGKDFELNIDVIPGAKATGSVKTPEGEAIVGAVIQASNAGGMGGFFAAMLGLSSGFGAVVTDDEGRFEIDVLAPGATYTIVAQAPDYPDASSEKFTASAGKTQVFDIVMSEPRYLDVRVVDATDGTPIPGATLQVRQGEQNNFDLRSMMGGGERTGADGHARIGPVKVGDFQISVKAAGYVSQDSVKIADDGSDAPTALVELTRGLVVAGTVSVPAAFPVQSARVIVRRANNSGGKWFHENPALDAQGAFRVDTIEHEGLYSVEGELVWQGRTLRGTVEVDAGTEDVALRLEEVEGEAKGTLVVTVLDADGKPVPSGSIVLHQRSVNSSSTNQSSLSAGSVTFRDIGTEAEIWVEVSNVVGGRGAALRGPFSPTQGELEIRLPVGRAISGTVTGPDGAGVRGVHVTASAVYPFENYGGGNTHGKAVSDGDGRFEIKALGELEYELGFKTPPDFAPVPSQKMQAGTSGLSVKLRAGARAQLTVLDFDGKPVPGAYAQAIAKNKEQSDGGMRSWTSFGGVSVPRADRDGLLEMRGLDPDATFRLSIHPPESRADLMELVIDPWTPADQTVRLQRAWQISGTVTDQKGRPAAGVWVQARTQGSEGWDQSAHTDDGGAFTLDDLEAGAYEVRASGQGGGWAEPAVSSGPGGAPPALPPGTKVVRAGSTGVSLKVDIGEKLRVRVRGLSPSGDRNQTATLKLSEENSWITLNGTWEGSDLVTFQGLAEGKSYELWIASLPGNQYVHKTGVRYQADDLEVDPKEGQTIEGKLMLPAGLPMARVSVGAGTPSGFSAQAVVDAKAGTFRFEGLPPGAYTLHAHLWHEGAQYQAQAEAPAGGTAVLELKKRE